MSFDQPDTDERIVERARQGLDFLIGCSYDLTIINIDRLDIGSEEHCVLGQLFDSYSRYRDIHPEQDTEVLIALGLLCTIRPAYDQHAEYERYALNIVWQRLLRGEDPLPEVDPRIELGLGRIGWSGCD
jgi:hypothetical protein